MLYKYLSPERIAILENFQIRFSQAKALNDPFESIALIQLNNEKDSLFQQNATGLDNLLNELDPNERTDEHITLLATAKEEIRTLIEERMSAERLGQEIMSLLNTRLGVLSLSRSH